MKRITTALLALALLVPVIQPATAAVSDYSWTTFGLILSNNVFTKDQGTGHATAANTFDSDYTVTATCVFKNGHTSEVFCGPEARQSEDAPNTFTMDAYAFYIQGNGSYNLNLHRLGDGTSKRLIASEPFAMQPNIEYTLILIVDGTTITGCVEDGPCIAGTDTELTQGSAGVGIRASLSSNPSPEIIDFTYDGDPIPIPNSWDGTFADDDDNVHEGMIEAIFAEGITQGCSAQFPQYYCPFDPITRAQMGSFLARALDRVSGGTDWFDDDDGTTHEDNINAIADPPAVTLGCGPPRTYCPDDFVTRAQMASFLFRAFDLPLSETDWFPDDDDDTHEDSINAIAEAGITLGCGGGLYCPNELVPRDQMASFIGRALGLDPIEP